MNQKVLFIDFDDTLSDYGLHLQQYASALGELLAKDFGGNQNVWQSAAAAGIRDTSERYSRRFVNSSPMGFRKWTNLEMRRSVHALFQRVNHPAPNERDVSTIGRKYQAAALHASSTLFSGVAETLQLLREFDVPLVVASGNESQHLLAALKGAGIADFFTAVYGGDIFDCAKEGPQFYCHAIRLLNLNPQQVIVVDDQADALGWGVAAGAVPVQVCYRNQTPSFANYITRFADLPGALQSICSSLHTCQQGGPAGELACSQR